MKCNAQRSKCKFVLLLLLLVFLNRNASPKSKCKKSYIFPHKKPFFLKRHCKILFLNTYIFLIYACSVYHVFLNLFSPSQNSSLSCAPLSDLQIAEWRHTLLNSYKYFSAWSISDQEIIFLIDPMGIWSFTLDVGFQTVRESLTFPLFTLFWVRWVF